MTIPGKKTITAEEHVAATAELAAIEARIRHYQEDQQPIEAALDALNTPTDTPTDTSVAMKKVLIARMHHSLCSWDAEYRALEKRQKALALILGG
jgi:hypothetical protein